jgi:hypothetical protein
MRTLVYLAHMAMTGRERDAARRTVRITDPTVCFHCKRSGLLPDEKHCPDCGFPQGGTEEERWKFVVQKRRERSAREDQKAMIDKARLYLFVAAGLNMIAFISPEPVVLIVGGIISAVFIAFAFWARHRPYPAILTGLITYVSLQLFFGLFDWRFMLGGLIWKIAIVGALFYALRSAKVLERQATDGRSTA